MVVAKEIVRWCISTKKPPNHLTDSKASNKKAATYSPTLTQYHRRGEA